MKNNKTAKQLLVAGEGLILIMGLALAWAWKSLPPQVPWFYSLPSGEQQLIGKGLWAMILGGAGVSLLITRVVARWASLEDSPVEITIMIGGLMAIVLIMASFLRVTQIVIGL